MGLLLRSCVEVRADPAAVWDGEWGHPGIHVLDEGPRASRNGWIFGSFAPIGPVVSMAYFVTEMYLTRA